jgi:hypothetical protein
LERVANGVATTIAAAPAFQSCRAVSGDRCAAADPAALLAEKTTQATSSLSRCRWKRLLVPAGTVSSNSMMLSLVSCPRSFKAAERG